MVQPRAGPARVNLNLVHATHFRKIISFFPSSRVQFADLYMFSLKSASFQHSPSENAAVVIDNGSVLLKAGFAGDVQPRFTVPSVVGRSAADTARDSATSRRTSYIGYEATERASLLSFDYPSSGKS